jgi:hypothetical protein
MPDGPYLTPEESALMRMLRESGGPEQAGSSLVARLEALEAAVAALEEAAHREAEEKAAAERSSVSDAEPGPAAS